MDSSVNELSSSLAGMEQGVHDVFGQSNCFPRAALRHVRAKHSTALR